MQPIYVGKGWGRRAWQHWEKGCAHNQLFQRKLDKIRAAELMPSVTIINTTSEDVALDVERGLIAMYGRINIRTGTLCNLTAGGDGYAVGSLPDEHKRKIADSIRGRVRSDEHRKNLSVALSGKKHTPETIEKLKVLAAAKAADPEFRQRLSSKLKGRALSDDLAEQRRDFLRQMNSSPERRAQVSAQMKARHAARKAAQLKEMTDA